MIEGKTKSGFKFKVDEDVVNSFEYFTIARNIAKGDNFALYDCYEFVLGKEQLDKLCEHVRGKGKYAPLTKLNDEMNEILDAVKAKNSTPSPA